MILTDIATNRLDADGRLFVKAFVTTLAVPSGTHRFGAFGRDADRHILVTECDGKPYIFSFKSDSLDSEMLRDPVSHDFISFIVADEGGLPSALTMCDSMNPEESGAVIKPESAKFYALERIMFSEYGERPIDEKELYHVIALGSVGQDSFLVLNRSRSDERVILFVPDKFTDSTKWVLAKASPWEYELMFITGKGLCIPDLRRIDARR